jgi:small GTP-binding protein
MTTPTRVLTPEREDLIRRARATLGDLRATLARTGVTDDDETVLKHAIEQLDDFFLLVVVGEFNAGKSALVNALLGERLLVEGVTPTTTQVQVLRHADQADTRPPAGVALLTGTAPLLRDIHLVDTPGTNAITREHEVITERFVPRADLDLFVTSADRPFTESERQFMTRIREWGKKVVVVINKADLLQTEADRDTVRAFVADNVRALLGFTPELFAVSARTAFNAKQTGSGSGAGTDTTAASDLDASGFPALERFILTSLDDDARFQLKLGNAVGVGSKLIDTYAAAVTSRLDLLRADHAAVEDVRSRLDGYRREMKKTFALRLSDVDALLHQFEKRGHDFFEDTVRVGRIVDLMNKARVQGEFERRVVADLPQQIERRVSDVIDWLVASDLQQWGEVRDRLAARRSEHAERAAGRLTSGFEYDRARLLDSVGGATRQALDAHDHQAEAARMAASVQSAVTSAALLEVGAVGLGTAVSMLATSTAADVTGILAAGLLATVGFVVLPRRRRAAKRDLARRVAALRAQLMAALTSQFDEEVEASARRIEDAISPYVQFVDGERESLRQRQEELERIQGELARLAAG